MRREQFACASVLWRFWYIDCGDIDCGGARICCLLPLLSSADSDREDSIKLDIKMQQGPSGPDKDLLASNAVDEDELFGIVFSISL